MGDLRNPRLIYAKGFLFLLGGLLASAGVLLEAPTLRVALLLAIAVWCFARFYYFAFYVIGHYVDPTYRFAGLWSFVRYLAGRRSGPSAPTPKHDPVEGGAMRPSGERDLATLLATMQPRLDEQAYVFVTEQDERAVAELMPHARCVFREDEGVTLIVDESHATLTPDEPRWARITLRVHSDLAAVGFLAAIATRLAAHSIAVNAVSAFYHDHLFVPWDQRDDAMRVLETIVRHG